MLQKVLRRFLFIQTLETPNPNFLKFVPVGKIVSENGTYDFSNIREASHSPLALELFCLDGVTKVFFGSNYISVGKRDEMIWDDLKSVVFELISNHYQSGKPIIGSSIPQVK